MSINLIDSLQASLNYPPLQKIDPNTQQEKTTDGEPSGHLFSQAAIPAVLTGLYKYATTDEGAEAIRRGDFSTNWVDTIFGDTKSEVVQKINTFSSDPSGDITGRMNDIAGEAVRLIKQNIKPEGTMMDVKNFMSAQRSTILLYLPAALHLGELLKDDTIDDNTNKMEGPISSLMHKIGSAFSNPANEEEARANQ